MPGPKPTKKPKPKPIKHADGTYSFIDSEDTLSLQTEIFLYDSDSDKYQIEEDGSYLLDDGKTITVYEGKISNITE